MLRRGKKKSLSKCTHSAEFLGRMLCFVMDLLLRLTNAVFVFQLKSRSFFQNYPGLGYLKPSSRSGFFKIQVGFFQNPGLPVHTPSCILLKCTFFWVLFDGLLTRAKGAFLKFSTYNAMNRFVVLQMPSYLLVSYYYYYFHSIRARKVTINLW